MNRLIFFMQQARVFPLEFDGIQTTEKFEDHPMSPASFYREKT